MRRRPGGLGEASEAACAAAACAPALLLPLLVSVGVGEPLLLLLPRLRLCSLPPGMADSLPS